MPRVTVMAFVSPVATPLQPEIIKVTLKEREPWRVCVLLWKFTIDPVESTSQGLTMHLQCIDTSAARGDARLKFFRHRAPCSLFGEVYVD